MLRNYAALCTMYGKDPEGYARRACWWTKELAVDMATNDLRFLQQAIENNDNYAYIIKVDATSPETAIVV